VHNAPGPEPAGDKKNNEGILGAGLGIEGIVDPDHTTRMHQGPGYPELVARHSLLAHTGHRCTAQAEEGHHTRLGSRRMEHLAAGPGGRGRNEHRQRHSGRVVGHVRCRTKTEVPRGYFAGCSRLTWRQDSCARSSRADAGAYHRQSSRLQFRE
jgi:hypothetical protein